MLAVAQESDTCPKRQRQCCEQLPVSITSRSITLLATSEVCYFKQQSLLCSAIINSDNWRSDLSVGQSRKVNIAE